ncbi:hypothetical protein SteCoe_25592 [Stentor coeruleus]|uniref:Tr-type G domain-containing protein n=1 Tax=Stentor coeruleus TaxID=5963 RepID=A0A1R2BF92_9CILI|nr:hypothetical protein SteCoe_25592 [Stentor coeruleus]
MLNLNSIGSNTQTINIHIISSLGSGRRSFKDRFIKNTFSFETNKSYCNNEDYKNILIDNCEYKITLDFHLLLHRNMIIVDRYFKSDSGVLVLVDLTSTKVFEVLENIFSAINRICDKGAYVCVVGTKADLVELRKITSEEVLEFIKKFEVSYVECSSLTGFGVNECILFMARSIIKKY